MDGSRGEPYLFISCSDDETIKLWGVKDRIKIDVVFSSVSGGSKDGVKKINVKNEKLDVKRTGEEEKEEGRSRMRDRSNDSGWGAQESSHDSNWSSSNQREDDSDEDLEPDYDSEPSSSNIDEDEESDNSDDEDDEHYSNEEEENKESEA